MVFNQNYCFYENNNFTIINLGVIHERRFNKAYHFSWLAVGKNTKWDWEGARNYCRKFCMDSISIETKQEKDWVHDLIRKEDLHYIWTGGRKCNFKGIKINIK